MTNIFFSSFHYHYHHRHHDHMLCVLSTARTTEESSATFTRQFNKSEAGTVCILIRATPKHSGIDKTKPITRQSQNADYNIVPVARSYNDRNWERVAGPYAQDLITLDCCSLEIPNLRMKKNNNDDDGGKLLLLSFSHELSSKEEVSRFFGHVTFGPTMKMINDWNYGSSSSNDDEMQIEMAKWLQNQMNDEITNPTYHRVYFRKRLDFSTYKENMFYKDVYHTVRPRHPCEQFARWRRFSFTMDDVMNRGDKLTVSTWNGQILLSMNGIPRTVVSTFQDRSGANINPGNYTICKNGIQEEVDGIFALEDPTKDCILSYNPVVNLPGAVITNDITRVSLPDRSQLGTIEGILMQDQDGGEQEELFFGGADYLKNDISNPSCSDIPANGDYSNVLGTFASGEQGWYAGHIVLDGNTIDNPIADAGSAMTTIANLRGIASYDEKYSICPVASKSFLNGKC